MSAPTAVYKCFNRSNLPGQKAVEYYFDRDGRTYQLCGTDAAGWHFGRVNDQHFWEKIFPTCDESTWLDVLVVTGKIEDELHEFHEQYYRSQMRIKDVNASRHPGYPNNQ